MCLENKSCMKERALSYKLGTERASPGFYHYVAIIDELPHVLDPHFFNYEMKILD